MLIGIYSWASWHSKTYKSFTESNLCQVGYGQLLITYHVKCCLHIIGSVWTDNWGAKKQKKVTICKEVEEGSYVRYPMGGRNGRGIVE